MGLAVQSTVPIRGKIMRQSMTGIVLAGGQSRRMGRDKASLPWLGSDILNTQLAVLAAICDDLIVVSNVSRDIHNNNVQVVADNCPGCGPLAGIEAGLSAALNEVCFIAACDMPFIDAASMLYIVEQVEGHDAAVPYVDGNWHPLYAAYSKTCLAAVRNLLKNGCYRLNELLPRVKLKTVSTEELKRFSLDIKMLENLNTYEQWQNLHRMP